MPISVKMLLQKQAKDPFRKQAAKTAGKPGAQYDHDRYEILVQKSALRGMLQRVVPEQLRAIVVAETPAPRRTGQQDGSIMYYILRRD